MALKLEPFLFNGNGCCRNGGSELVQPWDSAPTPDCISAMPGSPGSVENCRAQCAHRRCDAYEVQCLSPGDQNCGCFLFRSGGFMITSACDVQSGKQRCFMSRRYALRGGTHRVHRSVQGMPYLLSLPPAWTGRADEKPWPLLVSLHGAEEYGYSPWKMLKPGAEGTLTDLANRRVSALSPFVVVSPQSPTRGKPRAAPTGWSEPFVVDRLLSLLDELLGMAHLRLDGARVMLVGGSMGGSGVWDIAAYAPSRFAAAIVCAGEGPKRTPMRLAISRLRSLPMWVFHAQNDVQSPVAFTDKVMTRFREAGYDNETLRYTRLIDGPPPRVYPHVKGHAIWLVAFAERSPVWSWLLAQRRRAAPDASAVVDGAVVAAA